MPKHKRKTLFFDYDGVIADSLEAVSHIHGEIVTQFGKNIAVTADLIRDNWREGWQGLYQHTYGLTREEIPLTVPIFRELAAEEFKSVPLFKGMDTVIRKLARTHNLLILSGNYSDIIYSGLERGGIASAFSAIFGRDDLPGIEKSDPRFFQIPIDELSIEKEEVVVISDTAGEIAGARRAGLPVIACSWGWQGREWLVDAKPNYLADSPKELLEIIEAL